MKDAAGAYLEKPNDATRQEFVQKHKAFVDSSQAVNARFISMCLGRYQNLIETAPLRAA
jgi:hypothetical protein